MKIHRANVCMYVCNVIGHSPRGFLGEIGRQLTVKALLAAAISPYLISPTHPTHAYRDRPTHRELCALLFSTSAWVLSPADHVTLKMQETGPTVYSPYSRRLERLTI